MSIHGLWEPDGWSFPWLVVIFEYFGARGARVDQTYCWDTKDEWQLEAIAIDLLDGGPPIVT